MHSKDHINEKPQTKRKGYSMRNLFVTVVVALLTVAIVLPVQAEEASSANITVTTPCSSCPEAVNVTTTAILPQGETEEIQPLSDGNWGGDPDEDPDYEGWVHWWRYVMNVLYHYSCD